MNMEIILRGWKGVCWDLGVLLECARPGFLQTPCAEVMGRSGPKQPLGKRPGQVWEPVQLEQGLRHGRAGCFSRAKLGPMEVPGELCDSNEALPVPAQRHPVFQQSLWDWGGPIVCRNRPVPFSMCRLCQQHSPTAQPSIALFAQHK